jgi:hypothetical protein
MTGCHVDAVSPPSRCDPTPTSLAGGVLSGRGAFSMVRCFLPIWSRLRCPVSRGVGSSCVYLTPKLPPCHGGVAGVLRHSGPRRGSWAFAQLIFCELRGGGGGVDGIRYPPVDWWFGYGIVSVIESRKYRRPLAVVGKRGKKEVTI